jgi:hypothetical protein
VIDAGERNRLVSFMRPVTTTDDHGGEVDGEPTRICRAWVKVLYGTGQERREAAQERAEQAATFMCNWSPPLALIVTTDYIAFDAADWDITNRALVGLSDEIHFTAVRAA